MEEEKKKRNGKGKIIVIIVILVLIILGLASYIVYDKDLLGLKKREAATEEKEVEKKEENELKTVDISSDEVKTAMESFDKIFITETELYKDSGYDVDSISKHDLVGSAIKLTDRKYFVSACENKEREAITMDYLNDRLSNYFINKTIDMDDIKSLDENTYTIAQYGLSDVGVFQDHDSVGIIVEGDTIKLVSTCGEPFSAEPYIERQIVKAEEDNDYFYIYEKQAFAKYGLIEGDEHLVDYYKNYQRTEKVEDDLESSEFSDVKPNFDLYNTYKYTFKKQDGKYFFTHFELVK